jgi:hypothetical protein
MEQSKKRAGVSSTFFFAALAAAVVVALLLIWFIDTGQRGPDMQTLVGRWQRVNDAPGEEKILEVRKVNADGTADVRYFNPRPINVGNARANMVDNFPSLLIELPDADYQGSTYQLTYEPSDDELRGVFFQALEQQAYDVVFKRKSKEAQ